MNDDERVILRFAVVPLILSNHELADAENGMPVVAENAEELIVGTPDTTASSPASKITRADDLNAYMEFLMIDVI